MHGSRKPISFLLALIMVVVMFPAVSFPAYAATEKLGDYSFTVGTDTEGSYYVIDCAGADQCVGCGACEAACPQHLDIIEQLQTAWSELN